jgi:hypothetical protein
VSTTTTIRDLFNCSERADYAVSPIPISADSTNTQFALTVASLPAGSLMPMIAENAHFETGHP